MVLPSTNTIILLENVASATWARFEQIFITFIKILIFFHLSSHPLSYSNGHFWLLWKPLCSKYFCLCQKLSPILLAKYLGVFISFRTELAQSTKVVEKGGRMSFLVPSLTPDGFNVRRLREAMECIGLGIWERVVDEWTSLVRPAIVNYSSFPSILSLCDF